MQDAKVVIIMKNDGVSPKPTNVIVDGKRLPVTSMSMSWKAESMGDLNLVIPMYNVSIVFENAEDMKDAS